MKKISVFASMVFFLIVFSGHLSAEDEIPTDIPSVVSPENKTQVTTRYPVLVINNALDWEDGSSTLYYEFEVYSDEELDNQIVQNQVHSGNDADGKTNMEDTTEWNTWSLAEPQLLEDHIYYWRARPVVAGHNDDLWMNTAEFVYNKNNDTPEAPVAYDPEDGDTVYTLFPDLTIENAEDDPYDTHTYDFELYSDEDMTDMIASASGIMEDPDGTTTWLVDKLLTDQTEYWWRALAEDEGGLESPWSEPFSFYMDVDDGTTNEFGIEWLYAEMVQYEEESEDSYVVTVNNTENTILNGLELEIPNAALEGIGDTRFMVGIVNSPPELRDGYELTKEPAVVIVLGPSDIEFSEDIKITIPYKGDSSDPSSIYVWYRQAIEDASWRKVNWDEEETTSSKIVFEKDEFSLFAITQSDSASGDPGNGSGSGGNKGDSAGCFITSVFSY